MSEKDKDKSNGGGDSTYDKNYADYKGMVTKGGYGEVMTPEEWEAAKDSDD
jgi:hypothetical protein